MINDRSEDWKFWREGSDDDDPKGLHYAPIA
jgi:hypothetical protein